MQKFNHTRFYRPNRIRQAMRLGGLVGMAMALVAMCLFMIFTGYMLLTGGGLWLAKILGVGCITIAFTLLVLPMVIVMDTSI